MQKKINVGIIGRNFGYRVIYEALRKQKYFNVIGFSVKKKISNFVLPKNIKIYKNWKQLISNKKIKAIFISSPPNTHKEIINFSLKKNKHIFCEKPVTKSFKQISSICKKLKNKNIIHYVNYEFGNIDAFQEFKKKYFSKINIKKVKINWVVKIPKKSRSQWKINHSAGGGNFYNYICHTLFYLENLFGKIEIINSNLINKNNKFELITDFRQENKNISINLIFKTIEKKSYLKPQHKIIFNSNKGNFTIFSKADNLNDQFLLLKNNKIIFKPKLIDFDFRINPTFQNLKSFQQNIRDKKNRKINFHTAKRVHLLIDQIIGFKNFSKV